MKIDSFKYVPKEEFNQDIELNTSDKCVGIFLYVINNVDYWIELHLDGFIVHDGLTDLKFYTLQDAYKAMCIFIAENL